MKLRQIFAIIAMAAGLFSIGGASALAVESYTISRGDGTLSNSSVSPGQGVTFCGDGYQPNSSVTVRVDGRYYSTVTANDSGSFCTTVRVRSAGLHMLRASGIGLQGQSRIVSASLVIEGAVSGADDDADDDADASGSSDDEGLPFTGAEVGLMAAAAAALVGAGAGARIIGRRRRGTAA